MLCIIHKPCQTQMFFHNCLVDNVCRTDDVSKGDASSGRWIPRLHKEYFANQLIERRDSLPSFRKSCGTWQWRQQEGDAVYHRCEEFGGCHKSELNTLIRSQSNFCACRARWGPGPSSWRWCNIWDLEMVSQFTAYWISLPGDWWELHTHTNTRIHTHKNTVHTGFS